MVFFSKTTPYSKSILSQYLISTCFSFQSFHSFFDSDSLPCPLIEDASLLTNAAALLFSRSSFELDSISKYDERARIAPPFNNSTLAGSCSDIFLRNSLPTITRSLFPFSDWPAIWVISLRQSLYSYHFMGCKWKCQMIKLDSFKRNRTNFG